MAKLFVYARNIIFGKDEKYLDHKHHDIPLDEIPWVRSYVVEVSTIGVKWEVSEHEAENYTNYEYDEEANKFYQINEMGLRINSPSPMKGHVFRKVELSLIIDEIPYEYNKNVIVANIEKGRHKVTVKARLYLSNKVEELYDTKEYVFNDENNFLEITTSYYAYPLLKYFFYPYNFATRKYDEEIPHYSLYRSDSTHYHYGTHIKEVKDGKLTVKQSTLEGLLSTFGDKKILVDPILPNNKNEVVDVTPPVYVDKAIGKKKIINTIENYDKILLSILLPFDVQYLKDKPVDYYAIEYRYKNALKKLAVDKQNNDILQGVRSLHNKYIPNGDAYKFEHCGKKICCFIKDDKYPTDKEISRYNKIANHLDTLIKQYKEEKDDSYVLTDEDSIILDFAEEVVMLFGGKNKDLYELFRWYPPVYKAADKYKKLLFFKKTGREMKDTNPKKNKAKLKKEKKPKKEKKIKEVTIDNHTYKLNGNKKFSFNFANMKDLLTTSLLWIMIPTFLIAIYVALERTGVIYNMGFNIGWTIYDGYDFFISKTVVDWFTGMNHNFLSAITLGLLQIILIVAGFVIDLVLTLLILVGGISLAIVLFVVQCIYLLAIPALSLGLLVYRSYKGLKEDPTGSFTIIAIGCLLLSIVGCIIFYVNTIPAL